MQLQSLNWWLISCCKVSLWWSIISPTSEKFSMQILDGYNLIRALSGSLRRLSSYSNLKLLQSMQKMDLGNCLSLRTEVLLFSQIVWIGFCIWNIVATIDFFTHFLPFFLLQSPKPKLNRRACFSSNSSNHPPPTRKSKDSSICQALSQS